MLNVSQGRRDLAIALVGRTVSTFGDGVALVALTLRLQAGGAHPYEVGLLLAAGSAPLVLLVAVLGAAAAVTSATWSALIPRVVGEEHLAQAISAQQSLSVLVLVG